MVLEIKLDVMKKQIGFQLRHDVTGACGYSRDGQSSRVRAVPFLEVEALPASCLARVFCHDGPALLEVGGCVLVLEGSCM